MFIAFLRTQNLVNPEMTEGAPWDFSSPNREAVAKLPKPARRKWILNEDTEWDVYSAVRGVASNQRINKDNPPAGLRGLVADYDSKMTIEEILGYLNQMPPGFVPNFVETSLGGKARLVWVFEREILIPNVRFCESMISGFATLIGIRTLLAGYDDSSEKFTQVWTNGGIWHETNPKPMPWETVFGLFCKISKKSDFGHSEVPLEIIHTKIKETFPNRWQGDFKLNATGVRFWDDRADSTAGCQVKPDGMLCFTGHTPFVKWEAMFGAAWVNEQRSVNLGRLAGDIFYDDHSYWETKCGAWCPVKREDVILRLKARGVSANIQKGTGETISEAERILDHIQTVNRVAGAAPLINHPPGIATLDGRRVLNTSTVRALVPAAAPATPDDFPWLWKFLNGLFDRPEDKSIEYFFAWLKRAYAAAYHYRIAMGQAVFMCGPQGNGKTLLCYRIIKPLLGNKMANPYDYFTGQTTFNDELFESPLLAINDEEGTTDEATRSKFLARMKAFVVNPAQAYHPKFCKKISVEWTGRIFSTLNDDPASTGLLVEINPNTVDKTMFFGSRPYTGVWDEQHIVEERIAEELPYFARWLLDYQCPPEVLAEGRMGVKSYHDPRILRLSRQQSPAFGLLEILANWIKTDAMWDSSTTEAIVNPSELHDKIGFMENASCKGWTSDKIFRALRTLSNLHGIGIKFIPNSGRNFQLNRELLSKAVSI